MTYRTRRTTFLHQLTTIARRAPRASLGDCHQPTRAAASSSDAPHWEGILMYKIPTMEDIQKIIAGAQVTVRRLQRADELEEISVFIAAASLQECKLIIDDLIDRIATLVGLAPELEDAAASLNRSIAAEEAT